MNPNILDKRDEPRQIDKRVADYIRHLLNVNPSLDPHAGEMRSLAGSIEDGRHRLPFPGNP